MPSSSSIPVSQSSDPAIELAGAAPRLLAAIVDYLVLSAFLSLISRVANIFDWGFVLTLLITGLYFTLGHSRLVSGQTLGKRCFGLRVVNANTDSREAIFLSAGQALIRFFLTYGALILVAEVPPIAFRKLEIVAPPALLELHVLVVLSYLFSNIACALFSKTHQGIHDELVDSLVLRTKSETTDENIREFTKSLLNNDCLRQTSLNRLLAILGGCFVAILLWLAGTILPADLRSFYSRRYEFENNFPIRTMNILSSGNNTLHVSAIILPQNSVVGSPSESASELLVRATKFLVEREAIDVKSFEAVNYSVTTFNSNSEVSEEKVRVTTDTYSTSSFN
ncbi:MAG: RDD family protein [Deltaproteobacteria bacterium]|nr:RDD family protein [Deltaproteobacteria bacterium]